MKTQVLTTEKILQRAVEPLLDWYRENARDLPWRKIQDPYRIWISEIMLQQTRVAAVLGYYARFLETFPTVEALAAAPEETLMKCWEGLGYYSRARNLHRTARLVVERGGFPETYRELLELPGIGDYTASAIASAAFGQREAAVDGNVLRVVSRLTDHHGDILSAGMKKEVRSRLQEVMPKEDAQIRIFNQSVMELGALICGPNGAPRCESCPVAHLCLARQRGTAESLPVRAAKKARRIEEKTVYLLLRDGKIALRKRPEQGLLAGLWEFPLVEGTRGEADAAEPLRTWGLTPKAWYNQLSARHVFTHVEWKMSGYTLEVEGIGEADWLWVDRNGLESHAVPSAFIRYYEEAQKRLPAQEHAGP